MRKGATYDDFCDTVGIHPTFAENFTTLTVTKGEIDRIDRIDEEIDR